ncbi:MAG: alcohol dehydrogenase catalytic domain-containing protein [Anaerolineaceae bacterium]|nr:alcohol dehydrogenase catalytic domain-containing protein [Anaerolineaceae bacterium]
MYYNNHDVKIVDQPIPTLNKGEMLVKTKDCGVCVSDTMEWYLIPRSPLPRGHEVTGVVEAVSDDIKNFKVGDRVVVHHHAACLVCDKCLKGNFTLCDSFKKSNIFPGGFAEYFVVPNDILRTDTHILPDQIDFRTGTLVEPLACVIHALHKAKIQPKDKVVLIGTGLMGMMFIKMLQIWGVADLAVYEILEWRRMMARKFGAQNVFSPSNDIGEESQRIKNLFGGIEASKVIIATKDLRAMEFGINVVGAGGTVLFFATPEPQDWIKLYPIHFFFNEIALTASYSANHFDIQESLDVLKSGAIKSKDLITHIYPIEEVSAAILQTISREKSLKCLVEL